MWREHSRNYCTLSHGMFALVYSILHRSPRPIMFPLSMSWNLVSPLNVIQQLLPKIQSIQGKGAKVKVVATDRYFSIKSDIKRIYPDVDHQFDVCYLAKSVIGKLTEKEKKKDCSDLFPWIKSVSNHLWCCADTCSGNKKLLREK